MIDKKFEYILINKITNFKIKFFDKINSNIWIKLYKMKNKLK